MITLLENVLERTDGNYMSARDLQLLDESLSSWQTRKIAYNSVQRKEAEIIKEAIAAMRNGDRSESKTLDSLGVEKCQRDMTAGLRFCALAMLLEDEELLKDRFLYWQQNIFLAMQHNNPGYKFLGQAVKSLLPSNQAELIIPYMQMAHEMMSGK